MKERAEKYPHPDWNPDSDHFGDDFHGSGALLRIVELHDIEVTSGFAYPNSDAH